MTDNDNAAAMRDRLAAYDREAKATARERRRSRGRRDESTRRGTGSRSPEARLRIEALRARRPGDPLGTLDNPLPMPDPSALTGRKPVNIREVIGD